MLTVLPAPSSAARKTLPATNDWNVATILAERVFPGSRSWLLSCSASEGGHGGFVWNRQGSGAGGWLQFLGSTYRANEGAAKAEILRRGWKVPAMSYYQPLGQALVGAFMLSIGQRGQWYGGGC